MTSSVARRKELRELIASRLQTSLSSSPKEEKPKKAKKEKARKLKEKEAPSRKYSSENGLEFPVFLFNYKGEGIGEAHDINQLTGLGISRVSCAVAVKEQSMFRGCYLSYNRAIDIAHFKPTQLRAI